MAILIILLIILIIFFIKNKTKRIKYGSFLCITGALKTGKTALAVYIALKEHKKRHRIWWIKRYILFQKDLEEPMLYCNMKIPYKYFVMLNKDILLRKERMAYKSVCLLSESSLIADSQDYKDQELNENITLFCKLFAHETRGGLLICETQQLSDNHYAIKRITNNYVYIQSNLKIPFFMIFKVRELLYAYDDSTIVNSVNSDLENDLKSLWISKRIWKKYNLHYWSDLTDHLDYRVNHLTKEQIKQMKLISEGELVSFKDRKYLKRSVKENE